MLWVLNGRPTIQFRSDGIHGVQGLGRPSRQQWRRYEPAEVYRTRGRGTHGSWERLDQLTRKSRMTAAREETMISTK